MYHPPKNPNATGTDGLNLPDGGERDEQRLQPYAGSARRLLPVGRDGFACYLTWDSGMEATCRWCSLHSNQLCTCDVRPLVLYSSGNLDGSDQPSVGCENHSANTQKSATEGDQVMSGFSLESILGTVFYTLVVFGLGALSGKKIWYWVRAFFPWNKD